MCIRDRLNILLNMDEKDKTLLDDTPDEGCLLYTSQQTAQRRMEEIVAQMAKAEGVTEELKASDQMKWVGLMNNIQNAAEEMVLAELIYS